MGYQGNDDKEVANFTGMTRINLGSKLGSSIWSRKHSKAIG